LDNLRELTDVELAELGWFPVASVEYNPNTHTQQWNEKTMSYDIIELPEPTPEPADYKEFWNLLLTSTVYANLKAQAKTSLEINTLVTEFTLLLADAKFGNENRQAIQNSINEILTANVLEVEDLAELQSIFTITHLSDYYTL